MFCAFVSACAIALSISLPVFSCAVLYACVIFVISLNTLFVKFSNSSVIMLNCCRIMVDLSCGSAMLAVGVLPILLLVIIGVFEAVCV